MRSRIVVSCLLCIAMWAEASPDAERQYDAAELSAGQELFSSNCAVCHGARGEGLNQNWRQRDANGNLPPPPLNGTAHTWHHSAKALFRTISDGTVALGGTMPAWSGKLSNDEILLIINWITSLWPDEIYDAWSQRN